MEGTISLPISSGRKSPSLLKFLIITLIIVGGITLSHAVEKHKQDAIAARNCIDQRGADILLSFDPDKKTQLCLLPDEKGMAIRVLKLINGKWEEITAFVDHSIITPESMMGWAEEEILPYGWISYIKPAFKVLLGIQ